MKNDKILNELHEYRLNIMAKISENEKTGRFDVDVEDDPPIKKINAK